MGAVCALAVLAAPSPPAVAAGRLVPGTMPEAVRERMAARAEGLARRGVSTEQAARLAGAAAPDSLHAVVLLCDFADSLFYGRYGEVPGDFPPPMQGTLPFFPYAAHDSVYFDHQMRDVAAYFRSASGGRFTWDFIVHPEVVNLPRGMAWYGDHPEFGEQKFALAAEVVAAADPAVDFSAYDTVVLIHAGAGEETDILSDSPEQIYSGYLSPDDFAAAVEDSLIETPYLETDDTGPGEEPVRLDHVLVLPEVEFQDAFQGFGGYFGSLGVYCFEVGLRLGMLSLSDFTPEGRPDSQGIGEFGLMGYGLFVGAGFIPAHPCAFNKALMGWLDPYRVDPAAGAVHTLHPSEDPAQAMAAARVDIGGREYWLLEYRLQDPDGNRIFSFPGDLNGNNIPDFYDADSVYGDGTPTSYFDPATDQREWLDGAEFDFFMSENADREPGEKGAGSGLYVWHVDEGVVLDAIADGSYLFNSDAARKAVDLEEADGIQDLDSGTPSNVFLGGDDDSFRGEGADRFGPDTRPATITAGGAATGVAFEEISTVALDASGAIVDYAETMTFRCRLVPPAGPQRAAFRDLPDVDLTGFHLLALDLDAPADGDLEIVAAADGGRVFVFDAALQPAAGADAEGLLAVGADAAGDPVAWLGPPAAGDLDGAGAPEIVLTAATGFYVFRPDGTELADGDGDPDSHGLFVTLDRCTQPPVLVPDRDGAPGQVMACLVVAGGAAMRFVGGDGAGLTAILPGAEPRALAPPMLWGAMVVAAGVDGDAPRLFMDAQALPLPMASPPSGFPLLAWGDVLIVPGDGGAAVVTDFAGGRTVAWPFDADVRTPLGGGVAYGAAAAYVVAGTTGHPRDGWPRRPQPAVRAAAASPLALRVDAADRYLFTSRDGRIYLYDDAGQLQPGWPVAGPGNAAGTPVLVDLEGDGSLEIVAAGAFASLEGIDPATGEPVTRTLSRLEVWRAPGTADAEAVWPMWAGGPARAGAGDRADAPTPGAGLLAAGSVICYPAPLVDGPLHVRAQATGDCRVYAGLYNLEGELVATSAVREARRGEPVEALVAVDGIAAGVYLCRMVAEADGRREEEVRPVAVAP